MGGQEEAKGGERRSARGELETYALTDCWSLRRPRPPLAATPFSSRQPHTTKMGDGPEMVSEPTAEVMIHRPCLSEGRWQRANSKQMQMTQRIVYYTGGISAWFVYKSLETGSDQTKQIFIVGRKIVVAQISLEPECMLLETRSADSLALFLASWDDSYCLWSDRLKLFGNFVNLQSIVHCARHCWCQYTVFVSFSPRLCISDSQIQATDSWVTGISLQ